tara:strand:- start:64 stop:294 length:231 start_codon:yes stop_codon:yes gene_type:complete
MSNDKPKYTEKPIKFDDEAQVVATRTSHTLATLQISLASHKEIKYLLEQAGYNHAISDDDTIDMTGIALVRQPTPR